MSTPLFANPSSVSLTSGDAILTGTGLVLQEQPIYGTNVALQTVNPNGTILNTISMVGCNVGFGTTIPSQTLHVQGQSYFNGNVGIGTSPTTQALTVQGNMRIDGTIQSSPTIVSSSGLLSLAYTILFDSSASALIVQLPDAPATGYTVLLKLLYPAAIYSVTVQMSGATYGLLGTIQLNSTITSYQVIYTSTGWQIINELSDSFYPTTYKQTLLATGNIGSTDTLNTSISADGNTLALGGRFDNSGIGATWIFIRSGTTWIQQGTKLVGSGYTDTGASQQGGLGGYPNKGVALSSDGNTLAVGGFGDNSIGATWIFIRSGTTWSQQGTKLVGTGYTGNPSQGSSVALSSNGNTLAIGGWTDNNSVGATWIFTRSGTSWTQQANKLVGTGNIATSGQGFATSLSADGNTLAIGGHLDSDGMITVLGATWIFTRSGSSWTQQGSKLVGTGYTATFISGFGGYFVRQGYSVSLSADGNILAFGGPADSTTSIILVGATWIFTRSGTTWTQQGTKLVGTGYSGGSYQGSSVALSADSNILAIGGWSDNSNIGATWIFIRSGSTWNQKSKMVQTTVGYNGWCVSLSANANTIVCGTNVNATAMVFT